MIRKKVCMVGTVDVGKSSLVERFVSSHFSERYHATIGVKIDTKTVTVDEQAVALVLWDMEGLDEVDSLSASYLRGASGYLLVADGRRRSLDVAVRLEDAVPRAVGGIPFVAVLNKADIRDEWEVAEAEDELRSRGWPVIVTSAKTGSGVEEAFLALTREILEAT